MKLNPEINILLQIVNGDKNIVFDSCNIDELIKLAIRHKLTYNLLLFAKETRHIFNNNHIKVLEDKCRKVALRSLNQLNELKNLAEKFEQLKIKFLTIKGPQLAHMLYGNIALKESVDLDIFLADTNILNLVNKLLYESGYTKTNLNQYPGSIRRRAFLIAKREIHYFNPDKKCSIDLHIRPGANTYITQKNFKDFFEEIKSYPLDDTLLPVLPDEAYFVYLCYHGALHQFSRLAWLLDIRAFLEVKGNELNSEKITLIAQTWKVERCVSLALLLLESYFGDKPAFDNDYLLKNPQRMRFLKNSCLHVLFQYSQYGLSLMGRVSKIIYAMVLLKGFFAKTDWLYGVFMRKFIALIATKKNNP